MTQAQNGNSTPPRLPDYRPRGMSKWDKIALWTLLFIVICFGLTMAQKWQESSIKSSSVSATAPAGHKTVGYMVENTANKQVWLIDPADQKPFTYTEAKDFADKANGKLLPRFRTFKVYVLRST